MKTDSSPKPFAAPAPATADAFQAFFEMIEAPAALCDLQLSVVTANGPFEILCGAKALTGRPLSDLVEGAPVTVPNEGESLEGEVRCKTGQTVTLTFSRRGQTIAVVAKGL